MIDEFDLRLDKLKVGFYHGNDFITVNEESRLRLKHYGNNLFRYSGYKRWDDDLPIFESITDENVLSWSCEPIGDGNYVFASESDIAYIDNGKGWIPYN